MGMMGSAEIMLTTGQDNKTPDPLDVQSTASGRPMIESADAPPSACTSSSPASSVSRHSKTSEDQETETTGYTSASDPGKCVITYLRPDTDWLYRNQQAGF
jgi:hypothetical protein